MEESKQESNTLLTLSTYNKYFEEVQENSIACQLVNELENQLKNDPDNNQVKLFGELIFVETSHLEELHRKAKEILVGFEKDQQVKADSQKECEMFVYWIEHQTTPVKSLILEETTEAKHMAKLTQSICRLTDLEYEADLNPDSPNHSKYLEALKANAMMLRGRLDMYSVETSHDGVVSVPRQPRQPRRANEDMGSFAGMSCYLASKLAQYSWILFHENWDTFIRRKDENGQDLKKVLQDLKKGVVGGQVKFKPDGSRIRMKLLFELPPDTRIPGKWVVDNDDSNPGHVTLTPDVDMDADGTESKFCFPALVQLEWRPAFVIVLKGGADWSHFDIEFWPGICTILNEMLSCCNFTTVVRIFRINDTLKRHKDLSKENLFSILCLLDDYMDSEVFDFNRSYVYVSRLIQQIKTYVATKCRRCANVGIA